MRAGNREVNIFNMSLLDILCGALGAFCFMMLALFPHYGKAGSGMSQQEQRRLKAKENYEPVVVQMWWFDPDVDVDLYVKRPAEPREMPPPTLSKAQEPTIRGDVLSPCGGGPCSESWLMREVPPGTQMDVYFKLMKPPADGHAVKVFSKYMTNGDLFKIPEIEVSPKKPIAHVGAIRLLDDEHSRFEASDEVLAYMNEFLKKSQKTIDEDAKRRKQ